jgi:hypothetical protein
MAPSQCIGVNGESAHSYVNSTGSLAMLAFGFHDLGKLKLLVRCQRSALSIVEATYSTEREVLFVYLSLFKYAV